MELDPNVKPHWIISLQPRKLNVVPAYAETLAGWAAQSAIPSFAGPANGKWLSYIAAGAGPYVLRTMLVSKASYVDHLTNLQDHSGVRMSPADVAAFDVLPDIFWMVEFSLPALYTGNRSKLGEIFVDALTPLNTEAPMDLILGMRIPEHSLLKSAAGFVPAPCPIIAHAPMFEIRAPSNTW